MKDTREPPQDAAAPDWDRFTEVRRSVALEWSDGRLESIQQGERRGRGERRRDREGIIHFEATDSDKDGHVGAQAPEVDDAVPSPAASLPNELSAIRAYLDDAREALLAAGGLRETPVLEAEAHLYDQRILHEAPGRRVADGRRGVWLEVCARGNIPICGKTALRAAGETVASLAEHWPPGEVGSRLGRQLSEAMSEKEPARVEGAFCIVFASGGCEALVHEIGHLLEGTPGARASTWERGARIAPSCVTLVDDPTLRFPGRGIYHWDDEGFAPSRTVLIDKGCVATRIGEGRVPGNIGPSPGTGHGRRASYRDLPLPRMACTILEPGLEDPRAILEGTKEGLLVRRLRTGSMDPESGRVTLSVTEGFLIERGTLTRRLAPTLLVSDVATLLENIDAIGSDVMLDLGATNCVKADQQLPVMVGLPTIRIGMIRVISP